MQENKTIPLLNAAVIVAALGYFVDIYDLVLFSVVRVQSLTDLGLSPAEVTDKGLLLINIQMFGMFIGGILWGVLGDKRGRLSVLFGSIFLYSIANIANGMVNSVSAYALWRFVAGIGLAGELGAGITLVAEVLPKEKRGYGTMVVATIGLSGAILAGFIAKMFDWRMCYYLGGALGLALLLLRIGVVESGMFQHAKNQASIVRGNFFALFSQKKLLIRYLRCIFIGLPTWYVVGILVTFSPEFGKALQISEPISGGTAIMYTYGGLVIGDLVTGLLSQVLKSRIKVMYIFLALTFISVSIYLNAAGISAQQLYWLCGLLGFTVGFWVIFVTIAAEQFGTNIRATVTTTVPNFVRGALVPLTAFFQSLKGTTGNILTAALITGIVSLCIALISLYGMRDTFHSDLNYVEDL